MIQLASVIGTFEADFRAQYQDRLTSEHLQALAAMKHCRTHASPKMQVRCTACEHQILVPHSCGHRHCPHCQHHESQQWLERQMKRLVPAEYFLITFTVPAEFRALAFAHQETFYDLLLRCGWETLRTFSQNDKQLRGTPGAIAVLHTHTRKLDFHPHVHLVMPAAAVDAANRQWRTKSRGVGKGQGNGKGQGQGQGKGRYLFNHKALAKVFRAKLLAGIEAAGLAPPARHPRVWVVDCKAVGSGQTALIYLGRYLYRGVIREADIVACADGQVTFQYRNAKTGKRERRTVTGAQFLWLVLQHVLPKGFRRARNFGFLHPNCKRLIALLHVVLKFDPGRAVAWFRERPPIVCPCCGAAMKIVRTQIRSSRQEGSPVPIVSSAIQGAH